jgi:hypothetical protein
VKKRNDYTHYFGHSGLLELSDRALVISIWYGHSGVMVLDGSRLWILIWKVVIGGKRLLIGHCKRKGSLALQSSCFVAAD